MNDLIPHTAYFLHEDGTWRQPIFWAPRGADENEVLDKALANIGRKYFAAFGLSEDDEAEENVVEDLGYGSPKPSAT